MPLLDTFYMLFESDTQDLEKGGKKAQEVADSVEDGLNKSNQQATRLGDNFLLLTKSAAGFIAGFLATSKVVSDTLELARNVDQLGKFSQSLNENVSDIAAWGGALVRHGGDAQSFNSQLANLNQALHDTAVTGEGALLPVLNRLGISFHNNNNEIKTGLELLPELADSFEKLQPREAIRLGQALGFDLATIRLLQSGRKEIDLLLARQEELGLVTKEQTEIAAKFKDAYADAGQAIGTFGRELSFEALPGLTSLLEKFTELVTYTNQNENFWDDFFTIFRPGGGIIGLIRDDLESYKQGHLSVLGEIEKAWADEIAFIKEIIQDLSSVIDDFVRDTIDPTVNEIRKAFDKTGEELERTADEVEGAFDQVGDVYKNLFDEVKSALGLGANASVQINQLSNFPVSGLSQQGAPRDITISIGAINVDAQGVPAGEVAETISDDLANQLKFMLDNFDDGVLA